MRVGRFLHSIERPMLGFVRASCRDSDDHSTADGETRDRPGRSETSQAAPSSSLRPFFPRS